MEYKTNPLVILLTIIVTAAIAGGAVYFLQTPNIDSVAAPVEESINAVIDEIKEIPLTTQPKAVVDKVEPALGSITAEGIIEYGVDGSDRLEGKGGPYMLNIQETTVIKGLPESMYSERIKQAMIDAGVDYPWFGLMTSIADYIPEGTKISVKGSSNVIYLDEIQL